jgi:lactoylglutathione lyase
MQLGAFSVSLAVKDIEASVAFYEKLGFSKHGGDISQNWLILGNGRDLQRHLKDQGTEFLSEADEDTTGPASFMVLDPDGNPVLVDQHV